MFQKPTYFSLVFIVCFIIFGCKKNDAGEILPANIKCINASPDAPAINFLYNNAVFSGNMSFSDVSVYAPLAPATSKLGIADASNTLSSFFTTLQPGSYYSLFAIDSFSKLSMSMVSDVFTIPPADSSSVRFFHFSPDASYIVTTLENSIDTFYLGTRQFNDQNTLSFYNTFNRIPSGSYNLQMQTSDSTIISTPLYFTGGKVYTIYAKGFLHGTGNAALGAALIEHN